MVNHQKGRGLAQCRQNISIRNVPTLMNVMDVMLCISKIFTFLSLDEIEEIQTVYSQFLMNAWLKDLGA